MLFSSYKRSYTDIRTYISSHYNVMPTKTLSTASSYRSSNVRPNKRERNLVMFEDTRISKNKLKDQTEGHQMETLTQDVDLAKK